MNFKTTIVLMALLAAMCVAYVMSRPALKPAESSTATKPLAASSPTSATSREVIEKKLGDVVKVVLQVKGKEAWTFEKKAPAEDAAPGATATWRMTAPMDTAVAAWEVDKFGRELGRLSYEISYQGGEPGAVSAAAAGLSPPEAVVTLTDDAGASATIEIGKPATENETYVRLAGGERIFVGKGNLRNLWKTKALEYRDQQLWNFAPENVTRIEVIDRSAAGAPVNYAFAKEGAKWMMESPVSARATGKVDELVRAVSRLRVTQWLDDSREKLGIFGLEPAALTVRVNVEEKVPVKADEPAEDEEDGEEEKDDKPEGPPEIKKTVYELHIADRSPIGEETKTYVRAGDDSAVGTVMKTIADKFKPAMSDWRDMKITAANVESATRIEFSRQGRSAALVLKDGKWSFEDGTSAEEPAVKELLKAVKDMSATNFVEAESAEAASFGFTDPQAEIRLTVPGVEGVERLAVGAFTDEKTRRMVYVRRNDLSSIGKVQSSNVEALFRAPSAYRDRTVFSLADEEVQRVVLNRESKFIGGTESLFFEHTPDGWKMTEPVKAAVREDRMEKLVLALSTLRASAIAAESGQASAFGLDSPAVAIKLTHRPPVEHRIEEPAAEGEAAKPVEVQPPPVTYELAVTEHDGKFYAKRGDQPTTYEVSADFHKQLFDEYRTTEVLAFDDTKVKQLSIRKGDQTHVFVKDGGKWTYQAEPDLPLDAKKADNLLLQVKDLKTDRYVRNAAPDLATFGLTAPAHEVIVTLDDGATRVLRISSQLSDKEADKGHYAVIDDKRDVFLLTADTLKRIEVSLPELEKR